MKHKENFQSTWKGMAGKGVVFLSLGVLIVAGILWRERLENASWASSQLIRDTALLQEIVVLLKEGLQPYSPVDRTKILRDLMDRGDRALSRMDKNRILFTEDSAGLLNALKNDFTGIRRESAVPGQSNRISFYIVHFNSDLANLWRKTFDFQRTIKTQMVLANIFEGGLLLIAVLAAGNALVRRRHLLRDFSRLSEYYRARSEMTAVVRTVTDRDKIFGELCRVVVAHTTVPLAMVLKTGERRIVAAQGEMISRMENGSWILIPDVPIDSITIESLVHAGIGLIDLLGIDATLPQKEFFLRHRLRFFSGFPLYENEKVVATFVAFFSDRKDFSQPVQELFFTLTDETVSAMDHLAIESLRMRTENKNVLLKNIFQSLAEINESITKFPDPENLYGLVCRSLSKNGVLKHAVIGIYNPKSDKITVRKVSGFTRNVVEDMVDSENPEYLEERNAIREVFLTGKSILLDHSSDGAGTSKSSRAIEHSWIKSIGLYPIFRNGNAPYGVFIAFSSEDNFFDPELQALFHRVVQTITFGLRNWDLELVRKQQEEQSIHMSLYDPLTDLPNRRLFYDRFEQICLQSSRSDSLFGVGILDLNGFKKINDTLGHLEGDRLLVSVAERFKKSIRSVDVVARLGGDEFGFVFFGSTSDNEILFKRILGVFEKPFFLGEKEVRVSGSMGIVLFSHTIMDPNDLLALADRTMYEVKSQEGCGFKVIHLTDSNTISIEPSENSSREREDI